MRQFLQAFRDDENGATAIEYGLVASLISIVVLAWAALIGGKLNATLTYVANFIKFTG
jgi:pilus assembly protein Flp/PilA